MDISGVQFANAIKLRSTPEPDSKRRHIERPPRVHRAHTCCWEQNAPAPAATRRARGHARGVDSVYIINPRNEPDPACSCFASFLGELKIPSVGLFSGCSARTEGQIQKFHLQKILKKIDICDMTPAYVIRKMAMP